MIDGGWYTIKQNSKSIANPSKNFQMKLFKLSYFFHANYLVFFFFFGCFWYLFFGILVGLHFSKNETNGDDFKGSNQTHTYTHK